VSENQPGRDPVSRRTMLKRIGAAGAIAWATPVISSLKTPAFAASAITTRPCDSPGVCGQGFSACASDPFGACFCFGDFNGRGFCGSNALCSGLSACGVDGSCPPGFACGIDTCCGSPVCIAICQVDDLRREASLAGQEAGLRPAG
jgi:hypothetical protein